MQNGTEDPSSHPFFPLCLLDIGQPDATSRIYTSYLSVSWFDEQKPGNY